jgi:small-conductance mechanosensitive channel
MALLGWALLIALIAFLLGAGLVFVTFTKKLATQKFWRSFFMATSPAIRRDVANVLLEVEQAKAKEAREAREAEQAKEIQEIKLDG